MLPMIVERCLLQLMQLLSSKRETVVAESVVVIKKLLQLPRPADEFVEEGDLSERDAQLNDAVLQITRLFDEVTHAPARASIVWIVGEYVDKVKDYAPDILRQLAKSFAEEQVRRLPSTHASHAVGYREDSDSQSRVQARVDQSRTNHADRTICNSLRPLTRLLLLTLTDRVCRC